MDQILAEAGSDSDSFIGSIEFLGSDNAEIRE
jgi:hypothetical protein